MRSCEWAPSAVLDLDLYLYRLGSSTLCTWNQTTSSLAPLFGLLVTLWGALFCRFWEQRCATLACSWGTLGEEEEEHVRPEFTGALITSPVTGAPVRFYPWYKRVGHYCISSMVTGAMLLLAFAVMVCTHMYRTVFCYICAHIPCGINLCSYTLRH